MPPALHLQVYSEEHQLEEGYPLAMGRSMAMNLQCPHCVLLYREYTVTVGMLSRMYLGLPRSGAGNLPES